MPSSVCYQMLSVDVNHRCIVNASKPEPYNTMIVVRMCSIKQPPPLPKHYPLVLPVGIHIECAIVPSPTHKVSQARVQCDVVVAERSKVTP